MAGCTRCGRRCQGRLCRDCERDEYYGDDAQRRTEDREEWEVVQEGLGEQDAEGQTTLDGGITPPSGGGE